MTEIKNVMNKNLFSLPFDTPVSLALRTMQEQHLRYLSVIDENDEIIGVLYDRDLRPWQTFDSVTVDHVMRTPVYFIDENTPLRTAILKMLEMDISWLLISDEKKTAVGIITSEDLLRYLAQFLEGEEQVEPKSLWEVLDAPTLGEVARQLSLAGI